MKRIFIILFTLVLVLSLLAVPVMAKDGGKNGGCTTIQDGVLTYSVGHYLEGEPLKVGYDIFGYNYQAHMFNGYYANSYLGKEGFPPYEGDTEAYLEEYPEAANKWYWPYRDVKLMMKWSDIWLSNKDCNDDGILDRGGPGGTSSDAEGAWLTNHQSGWNDDGTRWIYFVKIVAAPDDAYKQGGYWYTADDIEIGPVIWGAYARILQISNDPAYDEHGVLYKSPASPGFGYYKP